MNDTIKQIVNIFDIYERSEFEIRPGFILTGPTGSSKTFTLESICMERELPIIEVNCAQLTNEGVSGNSVSKELAKAKTYSGTPCVILFDEFDKLFLDKAMTDDGPAGTTGVQDELLRIVEGETTSVYGNYATYKDIDTSQFLYIFAGAFNDSHITTLEELQNFGLRREFLGRVSLVYYMPKMSLDQLLDILANSSLLEKYIKIFPGTDVDDVLDDLSGVLEEIYDRNIFGARIVNSIIHQYFINNMDVSKINVLAAKNSANKSKTKPKLFTKSDA